MSFLIADPYFRGHEEIKQLDKSFRVHVCHTAKRAVELIHEKVFSLVIVAGYLQPDEMHRVDHDACLDVIQCCLEESIPVFTLSEVGDSKTGMMTFVLDQVPGQITPIDVSKLTFHEVFVSHDMRNTAFWVEILEKAFNSIDIDALSTNLQVRQELRMQKQTL